MTNVFAFCVGNIASFSQGVVYPLEALSKQGFLDFRWKLASDVTAEDLDWCDVVIACRSFHPNEANLLKYCRARNKYIIYCSDDDILGIPAGMRGNEYFRTQQARKDIFLNMCQCNCLYTFNDLLTQKYAYIFDKSVTLNTFSLLVDTIAQKESALVSRETTKIRIGFSGSSSHEEEINRLLKEPCLRIQTRYPNVEFEFFGVKPSFAKQLKNVTLTDHMPMDKYAEYMANCHWDIGLAPLEESEFGKYKCYNKFMEYGVANIAGIYSNVLPFKLAVKDGVNGIYADNDPESWYKAMCCLIDNAELRYRIAENASQFIRGNFSREKFLAQFMEKMPELINYKASTEIRDEWLPLEQLNELPSPQSASWTEKAKMILHEKGALHGSIDLLKKAFGILTCRISRGMQI